MIAVLTLNNARNKKYNRVTVESTRLADGKAAAGCIGHGKGIRLVAELFQRNDLSKKRVMHKAMPTPSNLNKEVVIKQPPASSPSPMPFWIIISA